MKKLFLLFSVIYTNIAWSEIPSVIDFREIVITEKSGFKRIIQKSEVCFNTSFCINNESALRKKFLKTNPLINSNQFYRSNSDIFFQYRDEKISFGKVVRVQNEKIENQLQSIQKTTFLIQPDPQLRIDFIAGEIKKYSRVGINDLGVRTRYKFWSKEFKLKINFLSNTYLISSYAEMLRNLQTIDQFMNEPTGITISKKGIENEFVGDNAPSNPNCILVETFENGNKLYRNPHTSLINEIHHLNYSLDNLPGLIKKIENSDEINVAVPEACSKEYDTIYEAGVTPLIAAIRTQRQEAVEIVKALIKKGADIHAKTVLGYSAFFQIRGRLPNYKQIEMDLVQLFISNGFDPNSTGRFEQGMAHTFLSGNDPLSEETYTLPVTGVMAYIYISRNFPLELRLSQLELLLKKADINLKLSNGITALHFAVTDVKHSIELSSLLLQYGADRTAQDRLGRTPFDL